MDVTPRSVARLLEAPLAAVPEGEAVVGPAGRLSYQELDLTVERAVAALHGLGVSAGTTVAVSLPNDLDIVVAFHAVMRLGGVWVGINRNLAPPERAYILEDSGAALYLSDAETAAGMRAALDVVVVDRGDVTLGRGPWDQAAGDARDRPPVDPLAPAGLAYTSGTTGRPKGVVHSQHNLVVPGEVLVATRGWDEGLRKGDCLPLTILNLIVLSTLTTAQAHGTCVLIDRMDAAGITEQLHRERVTTWNGVPALLSTMAKAPEILPSHLATLDEVWTGGDACPPEIKQQFRAKFGVTPVSTYGLTEAPTVVAIDDRGTPGPDGASGRTLPHLRLTIRGPDGRALPPGEGEVGEVGLEPVTEGRWAGLYRPMLGYLGNEGATAEAFSDGVLLTGDLGEIDADGYLVIRSRRNAVIIRGGANVYPAEVERVINEVSGIRGAVVFGVPDERLGQRVAAAVELDPGADVTVEAIVAWCAEQLAAYKVPERVVVLADLPRNSMGKVERSKLPGLIGDRPPASAPPGRRTS